MTIHQHIRPVSLRDVTARKQVVQTVCIVSAGVRRFPTQDNGVRPTREPV